MTKRATADRARESGNCSQRGSARHPTPAIDDTIYVGWNAMFVSAYLEAARVLGRAAIAAPSR